MASFSERHGYTKPKLPILEAVPSEMRNQLWSAIHGTIWETYVDDPFLDRYNGDKIDNLVYSIWVFFLKEPADSLPSFDRAIDKIRDQFFRFKWYEVFDFLEYIATYKNQSIGFGFEDYVNVMLEDSNSGYRFVGKIIAPITGELEQKAIIDAFESGHKNVAEHISRAVEHFSRRPNPDFRNSIKESISAVEAIAKNISGKPKATLSDLLKEFEQRQLLHPALKEGLNKLYAYTSDGDGIRHALMNDQSLSLEDAQFMAIVCSAFVNYAIQRQQAAGK